jgi:hypothetical protein
MVFYRYLFISFFLCNRLIAQPNFEVKLPPVVNRTQILFGLSLNNYLGDLGGSAWNALPFVLDYDIQNTRPAIYAGVRYKYNPWFAQRIFLQGGWLNGDDKYTSKESRRVRNLRFDTPYFLAGSIFEIYFIPDNSVVRARSIPVSINRSFAYIFGGFCALYFSPMASLNGRLYQLAALQTENYKYQQLTFSFPVGIGWEYILNKRWNIGFEAGYVFTLTDYLDDVSTVYPQTTNIDRYEAHWFSSGTHLNGNGVPGKQRGNPNNKDGFLFAGIHAIYKLKNKKGPDYTLCPTFKRTRLKVIRNK